MYLAGPISIIILGWLLDYMRRQRRDRKLVIQATDHLFCVLKSEPTVISLAWREVILRRLIYDKSYQERIWVKVEENIQSHRMVSSSFVSYNGKKSYCFQWLGR